MKQGLFFVAEKNLCYKSNALFTFFLIKDFVMRTGQFTFYPSVYQKIKIVLVLKKWTVQKAIIVPIMGFRPFGKPLYTF
jgi:hypothetical protein